MSIRKCVVGANIMALTFCFIHFTTPDASQSFHESLRKVTLLSSGSKFYQYFLDQNPESLRNGKLYFLNNKSSCALVMLLTKAYPNNRIPNNKLAGDKTGIDSGPFYLSVYGFNIETKKFDLLLGEFVGSFAGLDDSKGSCPKLFIRRNGVIFVYRFDERTFKYSTD